MSIMVRVAVVNHSRDLDNDAVTSGITTLQAQVSDHLAPAWNVDAELFRLEPPTPCAGVYGLMLHDVKSEGALDQRYPEATTNGLPLAHVFLGDLAPGQQWTHAASRELLNLLVDPIVSRMIYRHAGEGADQRHRLYVHDIVAPCAGYEHGYDLGDWRVSDFVNEAWFSNDSPVAQPQFDQVQRIDRAFGLLPGERVFAYDLVQDLWLAIEADGRTGELRETPRHPRGLRAQRLAQMMSVRRERVGSGHKGAPRNEGGVMGGP
jgi:hypothetical protein